MVNFTLCTTVLKKYTFKECLLRDYRGILRLVFFDTLSWTWSFLIKIKEPLTFNVSGWGPNGKSERFIRIGEYACWALCHRLAANQIDRIRKCRTEDIAVDFSSRGNKFRRNICFLTYSLFLSLTSIHSSLSYPTVQSKPCIPYVAVLWFLSKITDTTDTLHIYSLLNHYHREFLCCLAVL